MPLEFDGQTPPAPGPGCPVDCAISALGSRASIVLLRQAFYGDRRFDAFVDHTGISQATVAKRLHELVELGVMRRLPYREPGDRERNEYELTPEGEELLPIVIGLFDWGRRHMDGVEADLSLLGPDGRPVEVAVRSSAGQVLQPNDIRVRSNRGGQ